MTNDEMVSTLTGKIMVAEANGCNFPPNFIADVRRFISEVYLSEIKLALLERRLSYGKF